MKGIFCISLDFELHWGGFDKWKLNAATEDFGGGAYNRYFLNTRQVIPEMLKLFQEHEVHVTWAAVGLLLHETRASLMTNAPALKPTYKVDALSAYSYMEQVGIGIDEKSDPFHFGHQLVKQIMQTPYQELGTHTFSHYYCNEEGQTVEQFSADLEAAQRAASKYGKSIRSLVFPRNQFNDLYLKACYDHGIRVVRSNPVDWFWHIESTQRESAWKRLNRGLDAYFPVGQKNTYALGSLKLQDGYPLCLPASRLLRPYHPRGSVLNDMKIRRVLGEMNQAASNGEVYHLWWHPHNFGNYPEKSLLGLRRILEGFTKQRGKMDSLSMGELFDRIVQVKS